MAHDHPAVALRSGVRTEKVKCFLRGKWKRKDLIQIPSLNFVTEGSDLLEEGALSPFMQKNKGDFEVYAVEGFKVFRFGKLKHLEKEKGIKI